MNSTDLVGAPKEMLKEIQRQAELQLAAQLQAGIGADARALSFVSLMAAATVVVAGGAVALFTSTPPSVHLAWTAVTVVAGFILAMAFAIASARPTGFDYAGSWPSVWVGDVQNKIPIDVAIAEQLAEFDERLVRNDGVLKRNARWMKLALSAAIMTLCAGCGIGVLIIAAR